MDRADNWSSSDAFTKRESAAEELYIKQEENAKYDIRNITEKNRD